jgi:hypothetical protein
MVPGPLISWTPKCQNAKMVASSGTTELLQRHVMFHDFGVFNAKCPDSLSSELPKCRISKCQNVEMGSMTLVASHPMVATPPKL